MQVGRNLTDPFDGFRCGKRFLILDRDKKFTTEFRDLLEHAGTDVIEFIHHYHGERNHQGLGNALLEAAECVGSPHGKVRCRKRLGGLLSYYHRDAA